VSEDEARSDSLTQSVKSGVVWTTFTFAITKGLAFASLLVLTRLLAPSQFGVVGAIVVVLSLIELTADLGMGQTVIYEQEHGTGERVQVAFTVNMMLTSVLTAAVFLGAPAIASFFHATRHVDLFRLAALDVFLTGLGGVHDGLLLRDMRFSMRIVTQVVSAVVRAGVGVVLAVLGFGASSMVWGMLCGTGAWTVALWWCTRFTPTLRFDRAIAASILPYGIGASSLQLLAQVTTQIDSTVVGRVLGQRALGLYSVAFRLPSLLLENIANQVSLVAFPALSRKRVLDSSGVGASTWRLVRYQSLYSLPLAAGMAVLSRPIVVTVFSAKWRDATGVFAAVSLMSGVSASGFALGDAFKALGRQRVMVGLTFIQLPVLVVTIIVVAPYGITAVAWGRAAGVAFWVALMASAAARVLQIPVRGTLAAMWPGAIAAGGVALGAGAVRLWSGLPAIPEMIVAGLAGGLGGLLVLAMLARPTFAELRRGAQDIRRRRLQAVAESPAPQPGP
jgi:PST family polysaccharide transporter